MSIEFPVPLLGFVAGSGTGKTTLLTRLIPQLRARGLRCAAIKHSHHDVAVDIPGKDSHRLREAGAAQVMLASPHRTFWIREGDGQTQPGLSELLEHIDVTAVDLVLVEGFRHEPLPKIEVYRGGRGQPLLCIGDDTIIAVAADSAPDNPLSIPLLPLNNPEHVAEFVMDWIARSRIRD